MSAEVQPRRDPMGNPFQIVFSLVPHVPDLGREWTLTTMEFDTGGACVGLSFELDDRPNALALSVQFNRDLFSETTIEKLVAGFQLTLAEFVACTEQRLSDLASHFTDVRVG
jgi:hypothetical protein